MKNTLHFITPRACQGQIVEHSYACLDGYVIRHTFDGSDRTSSYAMARMAYDDEGDYYTYPPSYSAWKPIEREDVARLAEGEGLNY